MQRDRVLTIWYWYDNYIFHAKSEIIAQNLMRLSMKVTIFLSDEKRIIWLSLNTPWCRSWKLIVFEVRHWPLSDLTSIWPWPCHPHTDWTLKHTLSYLSFAFQKQYTCQFWNKKCFRINGMERGKRALTIEISLIWRKEVPIPLIKLRKIHL